MLVRAYHAFAGRWGIRGFVVIPALVYVGAIVGMTLAFAGDLPTEGWVGLAAALAFVAALAAVTIVGLERLATSAGRRPPSHAAAPDDGRSRLLVLADASCLDAAVCQRLVEPDTRPDEAFVVAPLLLSSIRYLFDDEDQARVEAELRLESVLGSLAATGVLVRGKVGADSPLEAVEDALTVFAATQIAVITPSSEDETWQEHDVVNRLRALVDVPVTHLVTVDAV